MKNNFLQQLEQFMSRAGTTGLDLLDQSQRALEYVSEHLEPTNHKLTATFLKERDLFHKKGGSFALDSRNYLPVDIGYEGLYCGGGPGSGKSSLSAINSCINCEGSLVVHDCEGDIYDKVSGALQQQGTGVGRIDYLQPNKSHGYNPLARLSTIEDCHKLASSLVNFISDGKRDFFNNSSIAFITVFILAVKCLPEENQHLYQVSKFVELAQGKKGREKLGQFIVYLDEENPTLELFDLWEPIANQEAKVLSSILATASTALSIFRLNENVRKLTSHDTLGDFSQLRTKRLALFLNTGNATVVNYYAPITSILIDQLFSELYQKLPSEEEEDIFFILDEAPIIHFDNHKLASICSTSRKRRISIALYAQEGYRQFASKYGADQAHAILASLRTHIHYSVSAEEAQRLSAEFGKYHYQDNENNQSERTRQLITADELLAKDHNTAIVKSRGMRPIKTGRLIPYYKDRHMKALTDLPPVQGYPAIDYDLEPSLFDIDEFLTQQNTEEND